MATLLLVLISFIKVDSQCCISMTEYGDVSCGSYSFDANVRDFYYRFYLYLDETADITFDTCASSFDTTLDVYSATSKTDTSTYSYLSSVCSDDCGGCGDNEMYTLSNLNPGYYVVRVAHYSSSSCNDCSIASSLWLSLEISGCSTNTPEPTTTSTSTPEPTTIPPTSAKPTIDPTTDKPTTSTVELSTSSVATTMDQSVTFESTNTPTETDDSIANNPTTDKPTLSSISNPISSTSKLSLIQVAIAVIAVLCVVVACGICHFVALSYRKKKVVQIEPGKLEMVSSPSVGEGTLQTNIQIGSSTDATEHQPGELTNVASNGYPPPPPKMVDIDQQQQMQTEEQMRAQQVWMNNQMLMQQQHMMAMSVMMQQQPQPLQILPQFPCLPSPPPLVEYIGEEHHARSETEMSGIPGLPDLIH